MRAPIIQVIKHSKDRSNFEAPQANGDDNEQVKKIKEFEIWKNKMIYYCLTTK